MKEKYIRFGDFIRNKRLDDPRELTMLDVAKHLGISLSYMSEIEKCRRKPLNVRRLAKLASFLNFSDEDCARMYDLAGRDSGEVPHDIEETLMYDEVGDLARFALRQSKAGFITEDDWKTFIRQMEEKKNSGKGSGDKND